MISNRLSNRQRMINLMYIIFIAIMALSISRDVFHGFNTTYENEQIMNKNIAKTNNEVYSEIIKVLQNEKDKTSREATKKLTEVNKQSRELLTDIQKLREELARVSDKESYEAGKIKNPDNMQAVTAVIFNDSSRYTQLIQIRLKNYRETLFLHSHIPEKYDLIDSYLFYRGDKSDEEWAKELFDNKSTANALTVLNNLETGILSSEKLVYAEHLDVKSDNDLKIGILEDLILEKDQMITKLKQLDSNLSKKAIAIPKIDNKFFVAVFTKIDLFTDGNDSENLVLETDNGTVSKIEGKWYVKPTDVNRNVDLSIFRLNGDNKRVLVGKHSYGVRSLPDPSPYITYTDRKNGKIVEYRGYAPIRKEDLISNAEVRAAISDSEVDAQFKVLGFQLVCVDSNDQVSILESTGSALTTEQKSKVLSLGADDKIHITSIVVVGPDQIKRTISSISTLLM